MHVLCLCITPNRFRSFSQPKDKKGDVEKIGKQFWKRAFEMFGENSHGRRCPGCLAGLFFRNKASLEFRDVFWRFWVQKSWKYTQLRFMNGPSTIGNGWWTAYQPLLFFGSAYTCKDSHGCVVCFFQQARGRGFESRLLTIAVVLQGLYFQT